MEKDEVTELLLSIEKLRKQMYQFHKRKYQDYDKLLTISQNLDNLLNRYEQLIKKEGCRHGDKK